MTIDLSYLKALTTAAAANQYDAVALNDYGMAASPATVSGRIAEIERRHLENAEGCKSEIITRLLAITCGEAVPHSSLNDAEGCKPDLITLTFDYSQVLAEAVAFYRFKEAPENYAGKVFTTTLRDNEPTFKIVVTTQRIGTSAAHDLREKAEAERDHAITENTRLSGLFRMKDLFRANAPFYLYDSVCDARPCTPGGNLCIPHSC